MLPNFSPEIELAMVHSPVNAGALEKVDTLPVAYPLSSVDRILSYGYKGRPVYTRIFANDYEKSMGNALAAFGELGIGRINKQLDMNLFNLHVFLGSSPGKKVYITRHYWSGVMVLLKDKRVENFSWTAFFNSSPVQSAAALATDAAAEKAADDSNGSNEAAGQPLT